MTTKSTRKRSGHQRQGPRGPSVMWVMSVMVGYPWAVRQVGPKHFLAGISHMTDQRHLISPHQIGFSYYWVTFSRIPVPDRSFLPPRTTILAFRKTSFLLSPIGGINVYIEWMRERVAKLHDVLKNNGSIYLHPPLPVQITCLLTR